MSPGEENSGHMVGKASNIELIFMKFMKIHSYQGGLRKQGELEFRKRGNLFYNYYLRGV